MKKRRYITVAACGLTVVWIAFIWINSMQTGSESGAMSSSVTESINAFLGFFIEGFALPHLFIRKMAHFLEFALLTVLLSFDLYCLLDIRRDSAPRKKSLVWIALPAAVTVAAIDETIQLFVEGRVGAFTDVLIDSAGALAAVSVCFLVLILMKKRPVA